MRSYADFDEFQRDLDTSERLTDDPFNVDPDVGLLDDEDLEALGVSKPKKRSAKRA